MSLHDFYDPDLYDAKVGLAPRVSDLYVGALESMAPSSTVMDLGCGTGDILLPLVQRGLRVIGVDNSPAMLKRCRERLEGAGETHLAELVEATLPELPDTGPVDAVIVPNDLVSQILADDGVAELFRNARRALLPGGRLLLDVSRFDVTYLGPLAGRDADLTRTHGIYDYRPGRYLRVGEQSRYNPTDGILTCSVRYELIEESGTVASTWYRTLRLAPRRAQEVTALLRLAGFEVLSADGDGLPAGMDSVFIQAQVPAATPEAGKEAVH